MISHLRAPAAKKILISSCRKYSLLKGDARATTKKTTKWTFHDVKDNSSFYNRTDYPHTDQLIDASKRVFGLQGFRPHQLEAINAALLGHHCFILMPTGGGKSLCFQLPAILTHRITFVVSPLKSLILDQVYKLTKMNIPAAHLLTSSQDMTNEECVYSDLYKKQPKLRIVYITPEKLGMNKRLQDALKSLYGRDLIGRLAVDEAHCVSMWGHDFRQSYTLIGDIHKQLFPKVPIMLLTATATPRVRKDVLLQMSLSETDNVNVEDPIEEGNKTTKFMLDQKSKCAFFIRSFLRSNLQYTVHRKTDDADVLEKIAKVIKENFPKQSGIIYCISRKRCEEVARHLRGEGLEASAYHALFKDTYRNEVQLKWSTGVCQIVCATVAFGMGIDKPDCRFVIHEALPKSLESFYQESGRAGRDGLKASSLMFYNYRDLCKWKYLLYKNIKRSDMKIFEQNVENVYRIMQFCDNLTDCRNFQILDYFGEKFDRNECMHNKETICDNCSVNKVTAYQMKDITAAAMEIVNCVKRINVKRLSIFLLCDVLRGVHSDLIKRKKLEESSSFGKMAVYSKPFVERIIYKLLYNGYLKEVYKLVDLEKSKTIKTAITVGPKAAELFEGKVKIEIDVNYKTVFIPQKEKIKSEHKQKEIFIEINLIN